MSKKKTKKKRKRSPPKLCVVFDTNVLFTDAAHHLLRRDVAELIQSNSGHLDLRVEWYLPKVVRGEREYQMRDRALALYKQVQKLDKLLGHQSTTEEIILGQIRSVIEKQVTDLGLKTLDADVDDIDWDKLIDAAVYRKLPFDPGEKEKGFRDAIIAEAFMQLVAQSPSTPSHCRLALVSNDELLRTHVEHLSSTNQNVRVLKDLNELEGLINTLVSEVPESKVSEWQEKAEKYFFTKGDETTLYYREDIRSLISDAYSLQLGDTPAGNYIRENGTWYIRIPVFEKKEQQRIHWTTQISVESEIFHPAASTGLGLLNLPSADDSSKKLAIPLPRGDKAGTGRSVFHLHWSVSISPQRESLSAPKIEGHQFIETTWEIVEQPTNALLGALMRMQNSQK